MNERVQAVIDQVRYFVGGRQDALALPRAAAKFVHAVVVAGKARRALEIGTSYGYSTLWIAAGLAEGGELVTIDRSADKHAYVRERLAEAGLEDRVTFRTGVALDVLRDIRSPVDFVLNDADKEHCREYFELIAPHLSPGAAFVTDNTLTHPGPLGDFLDYLRHLPGYVSTPVPLGNGMEMTVKTG